MRDELVLTTDTGWLNWPWKLVETHDGADSRRQSYYCSRLPGVFRVWVYVKATKHQCATYFVEGCERAFDTFNEAAKHYLLGDL